jgi:hypothetical protein
MWTTLFLLFWPEAMVTEDRATFKKSARNSMQAWLARPATGGAVRDSLRASPSSPVMALVLARGCTLTENVAPPEVSWIEIIEAICHGGQRGYGGSSGFFVLTSSPGSVYRPLAKDGGSYPHAGRAFFDGNFEVVRHAHR